MLSNRFRYFPWFFDFIFKRSSLYHRETMIKNDLFNFLLEMIEKKSDKWEEDRNGEEASFVKNTFLNRLLLLKNKITENQLKDHVFLTAGAGFGTTGTAAAHCILFLAMHPEMQEKAYQEIFRIFPTEDTPITHHSLLDLEHVIKETLRLGPTVHAMAREPMEDFELTPNEIVKKGSVLVINIYGLHRRNDLWGDDAEAFNPDRFLPENFNPNQQCYIPFSAGKRNCIGQRYASYSLKIMILKFVQRFKFSTNLKMDEIQFNRQIALKLVGPHSVSVEKRHHG